MKAAHKLSREPLVLELSVSEDVLQTLLEDYIVCSLRAERHIFEDVYRLFVTPADVKSSSELRQIEFLPRSTRELLEALQLCIHNKYFITARNSRHDPQVAFFLFFWNFLRCKFHRGISWAQRETRALIAPKCKSKHYAGGIRKKKETERERIKVVVSGQVKLMVILYTEKY